MLKILHITTHMGGGVGRAIDALICQERQSGSEYRQTLMLLEEPNDFRFVEHCKANGTPVEIAPDRSRQEELLKSHDVVVLSWWNHPKMQAFLADFPRIPIRLMYWIHVNLTAYPVIPYAFADLAKRILITSPCTIRCPVWTEEQRNTLERKMRLVYGMGNMELNTRPYKLDYSVGEKFRVGYLGTIQYEKLHPQFPEFCQEVKKRIPSVEFVMVGSPDGKVVSDMNRAGLQQHTQWLGFVERPEEVLHTFDVMGYLLNPFHFGTTENSILEAMAVGVPVVAMDQSTEADIIRDEETGFLVKSPNHYADVLEKIYYSQQLRMQIGVEARKSVERKYDLQKNTESFHNAAFEVLQEEKCIADFHSVMGETPTDWLINFSHIPQQRQLNDLLLIDQGEQSEELVMQLPEILKADSKSSIHQFADTFPEEKSLNKLDRFVQKWKER